MKSDISQQRMICTKANSIPKSEVGCNTGGPLREVTLSPSRSDAGRLNLGVPSDRAERFESGSLEADSLEVLSLSLSALRGVPLETRALGPLGRLEPLHRLRDCRGPGAGRTSGMGAGAISVNSRTPT
mmetsp:Transcript_77802/g.218034  ORF Transcript_77802/g.218034 Transcript_77802/m.218034 type:complete len:128 (+) Transcript_77802:304-687(+)